jgi:hypothetical protein
MSSLIRQKNKLKRLFSVATGKTRTFFETNKGYKNYST